MSSSCVCHTEEWCFYCEKYLPFEKNRNNLALEVVHQQAVIENMKMQLEEAQMEAIEAKSELKKLRLGRNVHEILCNRERRVR